jgi:hypothetical protein
MLDRLRENIERLAIGDPLQFYMLVGLLALLVLAMLLVAFSDSGGASSTASSADSDGKKKLAKKAAPQDRTLKIAGNGGKSVRGKAASANAGRRAAGKAAAGKKKAGKKAAFGTVQQEIPADFALLRRDSEQPADGPPALARLTEIEKEMLALRDLFQSGEISRDTYVTDSRALFDEAEKLAGQA